MTFQNKFDEEELCIGLLQDIEITTLPEDDDDDDDDVKVQIPGQSEPPKQNDLKISQKTSDDIYNRAGQIMPHSTKEIKLPFKMTDSMRILIEECKTDLKVDFDLNEMQLRALYAIGNSQDTFVVSPCGTGKMLVFYLSILLLRKIRNQPDGVGWILEPLVSISEEKSKKTPPLPIVYINKGGQCKLSEQIEASDNKSHNHLQIKHKGIIRGNGSSWQ